MICRMSHPDPGPGRPSATAWTDPGPAVPGQAAGGPATGDAHGLAGRLAGDGPVRDAARRPPAVAITVSGTAREPDGGRLRRAVLTLVDTEGRQVARTASGVDGRWAVAAPGTGTYVLIATAAGHRPQAVTVHVGARPVDVDVVLGGTGRLTGVVRGGEGTPVPGATVTLTDRRGEVAGAVPAGEDGGYEFRDVVAGEYTLTVTAPAHRPTALAVTVAARGDTRQDVRLVGGGALRGTVRTAAGRPVADARVTLLDFAGRVVATVTTGDDGHFRFTVLEPGEYTVVAGGYPPVATALRVGDGALRQDLRLSHRIEAHRLDDD